MKKNFLLIVSMLAIALTVQAQLIKFDISDPEKEQREFNEKTKNLRFPVFNTNDLPRNITKLNRYFKADDGSIVCLRQIGNDVYAIADRMDRRFSSVWVGEIKGKVLEVTYFYIPKGQKKGKPGKLIFKVSGSPNIQKLTLDVNASSRDYNFKNLAAINRLPSRLPVDDRAWYRGNTLKNLTGRWEIKNVGEEYYLDLGKQVLIYTVGGRKTPNARPQFTTLFVGNRNDKILNGFYVDLPLGRTKSAGKTQFKIIGPHFVRTDYDHFYNGVDRKRILEDKREIIQ